MAKEKPRHLLAIDPSLTASGWAAFALASGEPLAVGVVRPPGPKEVLAKRLSWLQSYVERLLETLALGPGDVLVCEGPAPLVRNPQSSLKVERVRSIFESVARARAVEVPGRLNPRTVQTELLGMRGPQLGREEVKAWARATAERLYGERLKRLNVYGDERKRAKQLPQDVIDALLIGALAVTKVNFSLRNEIDVAQSFREKGHADARRGRRGDFGWRECELRELLEKI